MAVSSSIKLHINYLLAPLGLKLETTLLDQNEKKRIEELCQRSYFESPVFPIPDCVQQSTWRDVVEQVQGFQRELQRLRRTDLNEVGFSNDNGFYASPDSDVLYAMLRSQRPSTFLEIGSGNSTRLARQAVIDGKLPTQIISIDPFPRVDIEGLSDIFHRRPVEHSDPAELADLLNHGDILFIDSSHVSSIGSDCTFEFLQLLPRLRKGVIVHIHDVSLPWDYPAGWFQREPAALVWNEQYLLQALLMGHAFSEIIWPGYFVQQTQLEEFDEWFPMRSGRDATAFWFRM
jgi:hypothetical protein